MTDDTNKYVSNNVDEHTRPMSSSSGRSPSPGASSPAGASNTAGSAPRSNLQTDGMPLPTSRAPEPLGAPSGAGGRYENKTEILSNERISEQFGSPPNQDQRDSAQFPTPGPFISSSKTQIHRPGGLPAFESHQVPDVENPAEFVVGWLVVVGGPGKGQALALGYGRNSVGRSQSNRVILNFGDNSISSDSHCYILYDARGREFFLQSGNNVNLTYHNNRVVTETRHIMTSDLVMIGDTILRFVSLCGPEFDWSDPVPAF